MVEQTRQPSRAVALQAGPGEVDPGTLFDVNFRYNHNNNRLCLRRHNMWERLYQKQTVSEKAFV